MKKLILSAAILLGGLSMQAGNVAVTSSMVQSVNVTVQDEYKEVDNINFYIVIVFYG